MASRQHRSIASIKSDIERAQKAVREQETKLEEVKKILDGYWKELLGHPVYIRQGEEEQEDELRRQLGSYLYNELVVKLGLEEIQLSSWRVDTGHHNMYDDYEGLGIRLANGKKFKSESGDWGSEGHAFNEVPDEQAGGPEREGKSLEWAWTTCRALNPDNDIGAIMALVRLALEWQGTGGFLDNASDCLEYGDDEQHRQASFIPGLLPELCKVLEIPVPLLTDEGEQKKRQRQEDKKEEDAQPARKRQKRKD